MISNDFEKLNHNDPSVITVGTFDGIHLGHQQLIKKVIEVSKAEQSKSIVLTFDPHPRSVLENSNNISLLNTFQEKENILIPFGLDFLVKKISVLKSNKIFCEIFLYDINDLSNVLCFGVSHFSN